MPPSLVLRAKAKARVYAFHNDLVKNLTLSGGECSDSKKWQRKYANLF
jgi:hypothetical protein